MSSLAHPLAHPLGADPPNPTPRAQFDQQSGTDIAPLRNPATGKFDIQWDATGNVAFDSTQEHAVLSLIIERKAQYWADTTGVRGSYLYAVKEDRKATPSKMQGFVVDALQPLIDNRTILPPQGQQTVAVSATRVKPGRIDLAVTYTTPQGVTVTTRPALKY